MPVLECIKPGAKPGQVILAVDLTVAGVTDAALDRLEALGYTSEIRHVAFASGVHVLAVLKDEQHQSVDDSYLMEEWQKLLAVFNPSAVHLWRGKAKS